MIYKVTALLIVCALVSGCSLIKKRTITFEGTSMLPSIKHGDRLEVLKLDEKTRTTITRGDIILFPFPLDRTKFYVKRVIALPGDQIEIKSGEVWLNGVKLQESYVSPLLNKSQRSVALTTLPPHAYYVLGDNRDNSADSRIWGPVAEDSISGKVLRKVN